LHNGVSLDAFRNFLINKTKANASDLAFFVEVEKLKSIKADEMLGLKMQVLVNCFLDSALDLPLQISIPQSMATQIIRTLDRMKQGARQRENVEAGSRKATTKSYVQVTHMFQEAQRVILFELYRFFLQYRDFRLRAHGAPSPGKVMSEKKHEAVEPVEDTRESFYMSTSSDNGQLTVHFSLTPMNAIADEPEAAKANRKRKPDRKPK
jgi:hypothetical protein